MPRRSHEPRSYSRTSMARSHSSLSMTPSDATYHSFTDVELYEPVVRSRSPSPQPKFWPNSSSGATPRSTPRQELPANDNPLASKGMRRTDSGYESITPSRVSETLHRHSTTSGSASSSSGTRPRTRPSLRRSQKPAPVAYLPRNSGQFAYQRRSYPAPSSRHSGDQPTTFFQFPNFTSSAPAPADETELTVNAHLTPEERQAAYTSGAEHPSGPRSEPPSPVPPQTTHYWTSDRTRRLEYAAIDAATKGVKGWVLRHCVPDCFIPKHKRRVRFEDDRGSVRRYRLDLDAEEEAAAAEKEHPLRKLKAKVWWFSSPRK